MSYQLDRWDMFKPTDRTLQGANAYNKCAKISFLQIEAIYIVICNPDLPVTLQKSTVMRDIIIITIAFQVIHYCTVFYVP